MRVVVTGGLGFIGSCIVKRLNEEGIDDIIVVDRPKNTESMKNLAGKKISQYLDLDELLPFLKANKVDAIIHMGACSSTTETNLKYLKENNFLYTKRLAEWCLKNKVRFLYASSGATFGEGELGYSDDNKISLKLKPLNAYGQSKQDFDIWVIKNKLDKKIAGFKFFNVFGPNEYHKGEMRSVIAKAYPGILAGKGIKLFKSYRKEYKDGEQKRDFVYVKDVLNVIMFFLKNKNKNGIFNVGTGKARSWNDLAKAMFKAAGKKVDIKYIKMPDILQKKYQYFTLADNKKLVKAGYNKGFRSLESAVRDYAKYLKNGEYY